VVDFFGRLHSLENITKDIEEGRIDVLLVDGEVVGTGSRIDDHITRVYVLPEHEGKGYGSIIMDHLEAEIFNEYDKCDLDASLPATLFYEHRGFKTVEHKKHDIGDGEVMIYEIMNKVGARIEKADKEDLKEILELQYLAYQSEAALFGGKKIQPLTETLEEVESLYDSGIVLKMTNFDGRIIGSVRAKEEDGTVYIGKLMVHPDYQKKGYGTRLLLSIEKCFSENRFELFTSTRSLSNIKMYERMGYNSFDTKDVDDELSFVYLEKHKNKE
jgi:GNAT superfamily N-acetyltransferase